MPTIGVSWRVFLPAVVPAQIGFAFFNQALVRGTSAHNPVALGLAFSFTACQQFSFALGIGVGMVLVYFIGGTYKHQLNLLVSEARNEQLSVEKKSALNTSGSLRGSASPAPSMSVDELEKADNFDRIADESAQAVWPPPIEINDESASSMRVEETQSTVAEQCVTQEAVVLLEAPTTAAKSLLSLGLPMRRGAKSTSGRVCSQRGHPRRSSRNRGGEPEQRAGQAGGCPHLCRRRQAAIAWDHGLCYQAFRPQVRSSSVSPCRSIRSAARLLRSLQVSLLHRRGPCRAELLMMFVCWQRPLISLCDSQYPIEHARTAGFGYS